MAKIDVAILLRCKSRTWQLEGALNQCLIDLPEVGITPHVILMPDKPSIEVLNIVEAAKGYKNVHVVAPPKCDGHRWAKTGMGGLNVGMEYIDANLPFVQWVWFHDDDELLGIGWRTHLKKCLEDTDTLAWLAVSLYIWSDVEGREPTVNINQMHYSPIFFKYVKGDRFPVDGRSVQVTTKIHKRILRNKYRKRTLPFYLFDYGVTDYTPDQRESMVRKMNAAGKDDGYTKAFLDTPNLVELTHILKEKVPPIEFVSMQLRNKGLMK